MDREEILTKIREADMVLVGLGEDFNDNKRLSECQEYKKGRELLREAGYYWLVPAWNEYCSVRLKEDKISPALEKLAGFLQDKNYFVVSTATDKRISEIPWKQGRLVMPCGTDLKKQCVRGCQDVLEDVTQADRAVLEKAFEELYAGRFSQETEFELGRCPKCGATLVLNNIYNESYNEQSYIDQWQIYTKWLQGTLNRNLLALELGVGMQFPSVIRWPFEKVVFFNRKATLIRVNEKLYQLTEELSGKGCGIPQNPIDWLEIL